MRLHTVRLPKQLNSQLAQFVEKTGRNQSEVMREALLLYLSKKQSKNASFYECAADLCGIIKAPADLSSNKKHLEGFGE